MKKTLILQCPGMVCSPPVVSKCLGEAHRRLGVIYIIYITLILFSPHTVGMFCFVCLFVLIVVVCFFLGGGGGGRSCQICCCCFAVIVCFVGGFFWGGGGGGANYFVNDITPPPPPYCGQKLIARPLHNSLCNCLRLPDQKVVVYTISHTKHIPIRKGKKIPAVDRDKQLGLHTLTAFISRCRKAIT